MYKPFASKVKVTPAYIITPVAIENGISFRDCSSLVYRHALESCVLILYATYLLKSFMSTNRVLRYMESLELLHIKSCHVETQVVLLLPLH